MDESLKKRYKDRVQESLEANQMALMAAIKSSNTNYIGNINLQAVLNALELKVAQMMEKLDQCVTADQFDELAKAAVDEYLATGEALKGYLKEEDLADYVKQVELNDYVKKSELGGFGDLTDITEALNKKVTSEIKGDNGTAKVFNEADGGGALFMGNDGVQSYAGVNDGINGIYAQLAVRDDTHQTAARLNVAKDAIHYVKGYQGTNQPENELVVKEDIQDFLKEENLTEYAKKEDLKTLATKEDLNTKVDKELTGKAGTATIFNEEDGGGAMFKTTDGVTSFVGVNDGTTHDVFAQLYVKKDAGNKITKLNMNLDGIYYRKQTGDAEADDELVVKRDIKNILTVDTLNNYVQKVVNNQGDVSYVANETNGGIMKITKKDGTVGKVTLYDGTDPNATMVQLVAHTKNKDKISKINISTGGAYYSTQDGTLTPDDEIVTKKDIKDLTGGNLDEYTKTDITSDKGTARIYNQEDGGGAMFIGTDGTVGRMTVNDGSTDKIWAQIASHNQDKSKIVRLNVNPDGIFYTKNAPSKTNWGVGDEIVTKNYVDRQETKFNGLLEGYVKKDELSESQVTKEQLELKADKTELPNYLKKEELPSQLEDYAKREELDEFLTDADLVTKADKTELEKYVPISLEGDNGTSLVWQDKTGSMLKFTKTDGTTSGVCVNDGQKDIYAQLYAKNQAGDNAIRLNVNLEGIYYTKNKTDAGEHTEDDEILTKADIKDLASKSELPSVDNLATKDEVALKADRTDLDKYIVKDIKNAGNDAYMNNETTGPIMKFVKEDGSFGKITLTDATDSNKIYAQIVASKEDKSEIAKLDISTSGIHYIKEDNNTLTVDNELVVKKDVASTGGDVTAILNRLALLEDKVEGLQFQQATTTEMAEATKEDKSADYSVTGTTDKKTRLVAKSAMFKNVNVTGNNLVVETEEDTIINGASITGGTYESAGDQHEPLLINAGGDVTIKNVTLAPEQGYNGLGVGMSEKGEPLKAAKNIVIDNVKITTKLANNGLNFYATADGSIITISNVEIEECSSPIRISNTNGTKCTVNIINCNFKKTEKGEWAGVICCEDGSSDTATADSTNRFGKDKLTINFQNVSVNGKTITKTDNYGWGTDDRLVYVYRDSDSNILDYTANQDKYPTINIL